MSDENGPQTEEQPQTRRGRPPKVRQRRNYARELQRLEERVALAMKMLRQSVGEQEPVAKRIVEIAISTLEEA